MPPKGKKNEPKSTRRGASGPRSPARTVSASPATRKNRNTRTQSKSPTIARSRRSGSTNGVRKIGSPRTFSKNVGQAARSISKSPVKVANARKNLLTAKDNTKGTASKSSSTDTKNDKSSNTTVKTINKASPVKSAQLSAKKSTQTKKGEEEVKRENEKKKSQEQISLKKDVETRRPNAKLRSRKSRNQDELNAADQKSFDAVVDKTEEEGFKVELNVDASNQAKERRSGKKKLCAIDGNTVINRASDDLSLSDSHMHYITEAENTSAIDKSPLESVVSDLSKVKEDSKVGSSSKTGDEMEIDSIALASEGQKASKDPQDDEELEMKVDEESGVKDIVQLGAILEETMSGIDGKKPLPPIQTIIERIEYVAEENMTLKVEMIALKEERDRIKTEKSDLVSRNKVEQTSLGKKILFLEKENSDLKTSQAEIIQHEDDKRKIQLGEAAALKNQIKVFGNRIKTLGEDLSISKKRFNEQGDEKSILSEQLEEVKKKSAEDESKISNLEKGLVNVIKDRDRGMQEIAEKKYEIDQLKSLLKSAQSDAEKSKLAIETMEAESKKKFDYSLEVVKERYEMQANELGEEVKELKDVVNDLKNQLEKEKTSTKESNETIEEKNILLQDCAEEIRELNAKVEDSSELEDKNMDLIKQIQDLKNQQVTQEQKLAETKVLEESFEQLKKQMEESMIKQHEEHRLDKKELRGEVERLKARLVEQNSLEQKCSDLEQKLESQRSEADTKLREYQNKAETEQEEKLEQLRYIVQERTLAKESYQRKFEQARSNLEQEEAKSKKLTDQVENLKTAQATENESIKNNVKTLESKLAMKNLDIYNHENLHKKDQMEIEKLKKATEDLKKGQGETQRQLEEMEIKLKKKNDEILKIKSENETVKADLEECKKNSLEPKALKISTDEKFESKNTEAASYQATIDDLKKKIDILEKESSKPGDSEGVKKRKRSGDEVEDQPTESSNKIARVSVNTPPGTSPSKLDGLEASPEQHEDPSNQIQENSDQGSKDVNKELPNVSRKENVGEPASETSEDAAESNLSEKFKLTLPKKVQACSSCTFADASCPQCHARLNKLHKKLVKNAKGLGEEFKTTADNFVRIIEGVMKDLYNFEPQ